MPGIAECGVADHVIEDGKLDVVLVTGFPAGMLACNCYVLANRAGSDAIIVDPGQRAMGPLRRILDENRLTPAAVLLTHGHIDHIWSAQKVADMYGCPAYIHPDDRFMLTDPIKDFGPRGWLRSRSVRCFGNLSRSSSWTRTVTRWNWGASP